MFLPKNFYSTNDHSAFFEQLFLERFGGTCLFYSRLIPNQARQEQGYREGLQEGVTRAGLRVGVTGRGYRSRVTGRGCMERGYRKQKGLQEGVA